MNTDTDEFTKASRSQNITLITKHLANTAGIVLHSFSSRFWNLFKSFTANFSSGETGMWTENFQNISMIVKGNVGFVQHKPQEFFNHAIEASGKVSGAEQEHLLLKAKVKHARSGMVTKWMGDLYVLGFVPGGTLRFLCDKLGATSTKLLWMRLYPQGLPTHAKISHTQVKDPVVYVRVWWMTETPI